MTAGILLMLFGCWLLCLPVRLRRWWTTEGGAILAVTGTLIMLMPLLAGVGG